MTESAALKVPQAAKIREELSLSDPTAVQAKATDKELDGKADQFVQALLALDPKDVRARTDGKSAVENMGLDLQRKAAQQSQMLRQPVRKIMERSDDKGDVGKALIDLKMEVEGLDPGKVNFQPGWFSRTLGLIPGVGNPLKRYFSRYESAQTVIAAIVKSLENGRDQLGRDNVTLQEDQKRMREMTIKLEKAIQLGQLIDQKLQHHLDHDLQAGTERYQFIAEELLFPLRQRIMDLQQQLAVNQQGVLATEIVIRNNKELARGVNRALNVTVSALQVGATVALGLANQKIVLDKLGAVTKTTDELIAGTAQRLKTQGVEIHRQAASTQLNMETLKTAFADIRTAMDDLTTFRMNALPSMAQQVLELDRVTSDAEKTIQKMEHGNRARPQISIDVE